MYKSRGAVAMVVAAAMVGMAAGAVAAGVAAAAAEPGDGAAGAEFHDLRDERQHLTNYQVVDRSRRRKSAVS
jgi:hypothetical protein